jgi:hypothetical protein
MEAAAVDPVGAALREEAAVSLRQPDAKRKRKRAALPPATARKRRRIL